MSMPAPTTRSPETTSVAPTPSPTTSRSVDGDQLVFPSQCYENCNNPYIELQSMGKGNPSLCEPGSSLQDGIRLCQLCIESNSNEEDTELYIEALFGPFLSYCKSLPSTSIPASMWTVRTRTERKDITTLGGNINSGAVVVVVVTELKDESVLTPLPTTSAAQTPEATSIRNGTNPREQDSSSSKAWIAGPVVGCVIVIVLLVSGFWVLRRRRRRRAGLPSAADNTEDAKGKYEKAELHADNTPRAIPMELEGSYPTPVPEMGANEVPAQELSVPEKDKRIVSEMAERN